MTILRVAEWSVFLIATVDGRSRCVNVVAQGKATPLMADCSSPRNPTTACSICVRVTAFDSQ